GLRFAPTTGYFLPALRADLRKRDRTSLHFKLESTSCLNQEPTRYRVVVLTSLPRRAESEAGGGVASVIMLRRPDGKAEPFRTDGGGAGTAVGRDKTRERTRRPIEGVGEFVWGVGNPGRCPGLYTLRAYGALTRRVARASI
ncbi:MAG: hypothetical protein AABN95_10320, partial [Acidobacteriota bacterium]